MLHKAATSVALLWKWSVGCLSH